MLFNSIAFFVFLPLVFAFYWIFSANRNRQNILLLLASYVFYSYWDWRFLGLIIISSLTDYWVGLQMDKAEDQRSRKRLLLLSLVVNLGILFFFKYYGFFANEFAELLRLIGLQANLFTLQVILPVGISFYTFQTLSYTIDIYRRQLKPTKDIVSFFAYVAFFPQLVAGPIERARRLLPQFERSRYFDHGRMVSGARLMLWGLVKKTVVADRLAYTVNLVYENPNAFSGPEVMLATVLFGVQIYCDFSGYSDIAIGTARLFGFELMQNFRAPFFAKSIREFWQRWHISLSTWFRDYVYIPLGGNRGSRGRWAVNIMLTYLISGLWHGANWTFLLWGGIHGLVYILESQFRGLTIKFPDFLKWALTFSVVTITWVFFRSATIGGTVVVFQRIPFMETIHMSDLFTSPLYGWYTLFFVFLTFALDIISKDGDINNVTKLLSKPVRWGFYYFLLLAIIFFGEFQAAPEFIYFQF